MQQLHNQIVSTVAAAEVVYSDDPRVAHRRQNLCFAAEPVPVTVTIGQVWMQHLDSNRVTKLVVLPDEYAGCPTASNFLDESIAAYRTSNAGD